VQATYRYCRPFLVNAPSEDLLSLFDNVVANGCGHNHVNTYPPVQQAETQEKQSPAHMSILDYCRQKGERQITGHLIGCSRY
jgi:hypothetical protein